MVNTGVSVLIMAASAACVSGLIERFPFLTFCYKHRRFYLFGLPFMMKTEPKPEININCLIV
jgi:hypothetical protein